jgi:hypothetical protein
MICPQNRRNTVTKGEKSGHAFGYGHGKKNERLEVAQLTV